MYLIELSPGREEVYASAAEFADAIRRGEVGRQSRIYHRATSRWISVPLHPEFKKVVAEVQQTPLPPLTRRQWTFLPGEAAEVVEQDAQAEGERAVATSPSTDGKGRPSSGWRRVLGRAFPRLSRPASH
jgi:hypothetical protein